MTPQEVLINDLTTQNDLLENYFSNTIIPQLFVDADLVLRKFTPPAMKQFNLVTSDVGRSIIDIKDNFRFPSLIENIQHVISSNEILEKEIQTTDLRWYQMNVIPFLGRAEKKSNGVIITFVEISGRIKDLKEQEALIADHEILLDTLSHDIKNPLSALVLAFGQLDALGISRYEHLQPMVAVAERALSKMQALISELVDSREKEHRYKSRPELLNLEHILEDVRLTLKDDIEVSGAVIKTNIEASELTFSRRKLRSVLYNLINNAIKYKSPDRSPLISIRSVRDNGHIQVTVSDNGMGIASDRHQEVFEKYYRVHRDVEGTGIGLYLVKEIINTAGGTISLKSQPGVGTEFIISLKEPK